MKFSREQFEKLVARGIDAISERFLRELENVVIVVEDEPTDVQLKSLGIGDDEFLFGLYEGVSALEGGHYHRGMPDKITLFHLEIEDAAETEADLTEIVTDTVWHEIAHHLGLDEHEVRAAERRRDEACRRGGRGRLGV
ncbi:MAG: metallopeptidase family protein [bacterium]|nr:metallopeptidase family protein [bacterium]